MFFDFESIFKNTFLNHLSFFQWDFKEINTFIQQGCIKLI